MDTQDRAPVIPLNVVEWLEQTFRNEVCPAAMPEHLKCEKAGEQNVVRFLRTEYERRTEEGTTT